MKRCLYLNASILILLVMLSLHCAASDKPETQPNVIIFFTDDMGYGDAGCYGATGYKTPNIDKMAKEGMRFTSFTVGNCICSPSRAALLTGRYPERWGYKKGVFFPFHKTGMPEDEVTIAEVLKTKGYKTGLVGKWHLGHYPKYLPTNQGFDMFWGIPYSNDMWQDGDLPLADHAKFLNGKTLKDYRIFRSSVGGKSGKEHCHNMVPLMDGNEVIEWPVDQSQITRRYTEKAIKYIKNNEENPFFLYLAHSMPHTPLFASEKFKGKTKRGLYGDVLEEVDWSVGEIIKTLKETGLDKNTLLIFTSDNGPWLIQGEDGGSAGDLRGGKGTTYEGGQRVPCVAWWPGHVPAGKVCNKHVTSLDFLPTVAKLAGADIPNNRKLDGMDIREILKGKYKKAPKRDFFIYAMGEAIRIGDWKYRNGPIPGIKNYKSKDPYEVQLFNLKDDPNEKINLADKYPEKVKEMAKRLEQEYDKIKKE